MIGHWLGMSEIREYAISAQFYVPHILNKIPHICDIPNWFAVVYGQDSTARGAQAHGLEQRSLTPRHRLGL